MQWRRLFTGDDRSGLVNLRLAQQRAAVSYPGLFQFLLEERARVAGAVLNSKGQRQRVGALW
ncbi:Uncharacterised protein [Salmonella enterica subsp. enterica serovar Bovismorbificans]|uniref:Uncharacterized protein n=1 Tax=Salmonella enterica subsp. enterica serovar Bovismorbificans TaxID=58097 RepID=A0A655D0L9_SALET|nr:Uncharacterised protein [Salmonella enterica subsp. enterica serovar Bovismorbificans]CNU38414.1 Uncharacterised protein [Salmonella enterica subsp. enterica serovar Bovismorbificans]CPR58847.1 Uncharacterised protein [Salmonella enterica subsp. enterica serovar Bovismorbificans]